MNIDKFKGKIETKFSNHAKIRKQQRGIRKVEADLVFNFGDLEFEAGGNCYKLCISKRKLEELVANKNVVPKLAEKCEHLVILTDGSSIITVYRNRKSKR